MVTIWILSNLELIEFFSSSHFEFSQNLRFVTIWALSQFKFCHNLSFWVLSQFKFDNNLGFFFLHKIWVFECCCNLSFWVLVIIQVLKFCQNLSFSFSQFEFCHNLSFQVLSLFKCSSFVGIWVFELCQHSQLFHANATVRHCWKKFKVKIQIDHWWWKLHWCS